MAFFPSPSHSPNSLIPPSFSLLLFNTPHTLVASTLRAYPTLRYNASHCK